MVQSSSSIDADLLSLLACPRDRLPVTADGRFLVCNAGHRYPIVDGVPVFICAEKPQSLKLASESLRAAETGAGAPFFLNTVGSISEERRRLIELDLRREQIGIDPVVSWRVLATCGFGYASLLGKLKSYPIPDIPFPTSNNDRRLLDIGCNWGRWSLSAVRKGWRVVGIDPSLGAIMAARRMAAAEQRQIAVVCGDARFMPFKSNIFHAAFAYSVLQHFDEVEAKIILGEIARVVEPGGVVKVQMAHRYGLRSTYHRTHPNYLESGGFRVRYWTWSELQHAFESIIGPTILNPEAFGGLGLLYSDRKSVPPAVRVLIIISEMLKLVARLVPPIRYMADSVMVESRKIQC